jgi:hypothetical protein
MNSLSLSGLGLLPRQAILMLLTSLQQALVLSVTQSRSIRAILGDMSDSYYQGLFFFLQRSCQILGIVSLLVFLIWASSVAI